MSKMTWAAILPLVLLGAAVGAQEKPQPDKPPAEGPRKPLIPLKLQVVFSRFMGEKKVSSLPYTLTVNAVNAPNGKFSRLRMGISVPVQTVANNTTTVTFKDATNNVDCSAETLDDGRFKLNCSIEQSSIYAEEGARPIGPAATTSSLVQTPLLRTFRSEAELMMRDGQTTQFASATDPVSGELLKIELTLNVIK